jgi:dCMP deaminase
MVDYSDPKAFNEPTRPSWDEYFMMASKLAATRATCLQRKVGSVIVKNKRIIATGFNGSPPGLPHCIEDGCLMFKDRGTTCQRVLHSEHNAILQGTGGLEGSTLYTSFLPCLNCMKIIIAAKITEVVYEKEHQEKDEYENAKREFANEANLKLRQIPEINIVETLSRYYA